MPHSLEFPGGVRSSYSSLSLDLSGQARSGLLLPIRDSIPPAALEEQGNGVGSCVRSVMAASLSAHILNGHIPKKNTNYGDTE